MNNARSYAGQANQLNIATGHDQTKININETNNEFKGGQNDANRNTQTGIAGMRNATTMRGQDLVNGLGYDQMAVKKAIAEDNARRQERMQKERLEADKAEQTAREQEKYGNKQAAAIIRGHNIARSNANQQRDMYLGIMKEAQQYKGRERDVKDAYDAFIHWNNVSLELAKNNPMGAPQPMPQQPTTQPIGGGMPPGQPMAAQQPSQPIQLNPQNPDQHYNELPPGAMFVGPDGQPRQKPMVDSDQLDQSVIQEGQNYGRQVLSDQQRAKLQNEYNQYQKDIRAVSSHPYGSPQVVGLYREKMKEIERKLEEDDRAKGGW